jgi:protein-S-isoprenylcysteine O-methyltransferase Ste14
MRPNVNLPSDHAPRGTILGVLYAGACYLVFQGTFVYFILFVNGAWVPKGVQDGVLRPVPIALAIDLGLVLLWGLQHSVMARRSFKERWTRLVPPHVERATYGLASALALGVVMIGWSPIAGTVWVVESSFARGAILALQVGAWLLLVAASFEIDHYETFGLKQPLQAMRGRSGDPIDFQAKRIYRIVRHPIQTGIFVGIWAAPEMSWSRFVFASLMTVYIFVGLYFEERDLIREFGERYRRYQAEVPRLLPGRKRGSSRP